MYEQDDDELMSAIYGDQASVSAPGPSTPGTATLSPVSAPAAATSPQPAAPADPSQAPAPSGGGDIFSAIYNAPTNASSGSPGGNITDAVRSKPPAQPAGTTIQAGQPNPDERIARYQETAARISSSADPMEQARARDTLSRQLATDFQAAGHQVKWDGDVLVVDGRRYTVGGNTPGYDGAADGGVTGGAAVQQIRQQALAGQGAPLGAPPAGFDAAKWADAGHNTPKYDVTRALMGAGVQDQLRAIPDEAGRKAFMEEQLRSLIPVFEASGAKVHDVRGEKVLIETADAGLHWVDAVQDIEGAANLQWHVDQGQGGAAPPPGVVGIDAPGAGGLPRTGAPAPTGGPGAPPAPGAPGGFTPTGPTYTPGAITDDDIPDFTTEGLAAQMGSYTPGRYEVGDLGVGPVEGDVDAIMRGILQNPESLDAAAVERLKVGNREEAADQLALDDDALTAMGYEFGIEGSPFLASQRMASRQRANETIQRGNRGVDIEAARTNAADRRSAAALGSSHLAEVGSRRRGDEALRQSAASMNESNAFNAAKLESDNVTNAAKLSLDAAAQRGDRMALRESVHQAAAELGISRDKLMLDYVTSTMDDLTRRYGIDVDAALRREGIQVDRETLAQRGSEFQQELAFKLRQLAAQYEVDMGGLALGWGNLEQRGNEAELNALMGAIYG